MMDELSMLVQDPSVLNERAQGGSTNIFRELLCACVRVDNVITPTIVG